MSAPDVGAAERLAELKRCRLDAATYMAGLGAGWNLGVTDNNDKFNAIREQYGRDLADYTREKAALLTALQDADHADR